MRKRKYEEAICGGRREYMIDGYGDKILSEEITLFSYECNDYKVECKKENDQIRIIASGGTSNKRDGTNFKLDYETNEETILKELQKIVKKYHLSKNNGHYEEVGGLPPGCGDKLEIEYRSKEKIYKYSNQTPHLSDEAQQEVYKVFLEDAKKNELDFTTAKSNVQIYDDADVDYLQGTWKGKHFGKEFKVVIEENHIEIYCDGEKTDDTEYTIINGNVRKNQLKEGKEGKDEYDYEEFSEISAMKKKNSFTLVAYFMKNGYSTDDLLRQSKEDL